MNKSKMIVTDFDPEGLFAEWILPPRFRQRQSETRFIQRWKLTIPQYMTMMREVVGPRKQRGSIILASSTPSATIFQGAVNLSNRTLTSTALGLLVTSRVKFQPDGTLVHESTGTDIDVASGEWNTGEPFTAIGADYEVRALSAGKGGSPGTWITPAEVDDIWIDISADREWGTPPRIAKSAPGTNTTFATFELGDNGASSADDSAVITVVATN